MIEQVIASFLQESSKENLIDLVTALSDTMVLVPFTIVGGKGIHMEVDQLVDSHQCVHYPIFTTNDEIPTEYKSGFIWKNQSFAACVTSACKQQIPIVLNAYSSNIVFPLDLLEIIHTSQKS